MIAVGKTASLTVTLKAGQYFVWDPIHSSMTNSKALTVKDADHGHSAERRGRHHHPEQ